jgi:hypothetical protein
MPRLGLLTGIGNGGGVGAANPLPTWSTFIAPRAVSPFAPTTASRIYDAVTVTESTDRTLPFGPGAGRDPGRALFGGAKVAG